MQKFWYFYLLTVTLEALTVQEKITMVSIHEESARNINDAFTLYAHRFPDTCYFIPSIQTNRHQCTCTSKKGR